MMKIGSLALIPMMLFGILLFSASSFSQDPFEQTQITRSDYLSMDKQVSILEFRVKELEKNNDKIDALKIENLGNKAEIQWLHTIVFSWYGFITLIVSIITIIIGIFTYNKTKNMAEEKCAKWLKDHEKEIFENIEIQANSWLTNNKNEVIQHIKDTLSIEFINSLDREDGKELIRQVIREEISQISNDSTTSKNAHSQNNRQDFEQHSIESKDLIIEDSMPAIQDSFKSITTNENNEEREVVELFEKAINGHGTEKISAYSELIDQFKNSKNEKILIYVAMAYWNLALSLQGQYQIDTYRELIEQFKNNKNDKILLPVAKAYFNLGSNLKGSDGNNTHRELIEQFKNSENEEILIQVAKAYFNLGNNLKGSDGNNTHRELIEQFKNSENEEILIRVAKAYFNLGNNLEGQDKIDTYRELIEQFKNSKNEKILEVVASAYFNLALSLEGQYQIDTYRELIEQFKNSKNEKILLPVAIAYVNLANELIENNQRSEAIQLLSEAIQKFKNSDDQEIKLQLAKMEFLHNSLIQNS